MVNIGFIDCCGWGSHRVPVGPFDGLFDPDGPDSDGPDRQPSRVHSGVDQLHRIGSEHRRTVRNGGAVQHLRQPAPGSRRENPAQSQPVAAPAQRGFPDGSQSRQRQRRIELIFVQDPSVDSRQRRSAVEEPVRRLVRPAGRARSLSPPVLSLLDAGRSCSHVPVAHHRLRQQRNQFHAQAHRCRLGSVFPLNFK